MAYNEGASCGIMNHVLVTDTILIAAVTENYLLSFIGAAIYISALRKLKIRKSCRQHKKEKLKL